MDVFPAGPRLRLIDDSPWYELFEDYKYVGDNYTVIVRAGFQCDLASFDGILYDHKSFGCGPPLLHDFFYHRQGKVADCEYGVFRCDGVRTDIVKKEADLIFYDAMRATGVNFFRANIAYLAVRSLGMWAWRDTRAGDKKYS